MMPGLLLDLVLGFGIGLSLGLLGGGGSILTVPALVYLVGQAPQAAVVTSLVIVGANSLVGAIFHQRQGGGLNWKVAFLFGGTGMVAAFFAAGFSKQISPVWLLVSFAALMIVVGGLMFFQKERTDNWIDKNPKWWVTLISGAGVGLLTGVLGVGGGFLIVPALVFMGLLLHETDDILAALREAHRVAAMRLAILEWPQANTSLIMSVICFAV